MAKEKLDFVKPLTKRPQNLKILLLIMTTSRDNVKQKEINP